MTIEDVERQLQGVTYSEAIAHYRTLKDNFITSYTSQLNAEVKEKGEEYIQNFITEINQNNFQGKSFAAVNHLTSQLESALGKALSSADLSQFDEIFKETQKYSDLSEKGKKELKNILDQYFNSNIIDRYVKEALRFLKIRTNQKGLNTSDLLIWSRSYVQQLLFANIKKINASPNKAAAAGYFEEALVHKATQQLTKHLKNKAGAIQTGSTKIKSFSTGKSIDTIFDEYFNFCNSDLNKTFKASVDVDTNSLTSGFGAQVKLKNLPWKIANPKGKYFPVGNNSLLFARWAEKTSWIKGVLFLEKNAIQALGDNVMYVAGNSFIWTADLITEAKTNAYYLAFFYDNDKEDFTSTIRWEHIDLIKP